MNFIRQKTVQASVCVLRTALYLHQKNIFVLQQTQFNRKYQHINLFQKQSKELICTAILRPLTKPLDVTEAAIVTLPDSGEEYPEQVDSNRESQPKHHLNPLKHVIKKMDKRKLKKKIPDFGVTVFPIPLQWIEAVREGEVYAEILCSAELIQVK